MEDHKIYLVCYEIRITDRGCGISPENVKRLFLDFNKLEESALQNKNGVGLGLSICKMLIEQMCGRVDVDSKLGEGTTFTITFKTACAVNANEAPCQVQRMVSSPSQHEDKSETITQQLQMFDFDNYFSD